MVEPHALSLRTTKRCTGMLCRAAMRRRQWEVSVLVA